MSFSADFFTDTFLSKEIEGDVRLKTAPGRFLQPHDERTGMVIRPSLHVPCEESLPGDKSQDIETSATVSQSKFLRKKEL